VISDARRRNRHQHRLAPNVEVQIEGVAQNVLSINSRGTERDFRLALSPGANSTNDFGDFTLWTKIKLRNESANLPSVGFRFGVQLPNSNQGRGHRIESDERLWQILLGKKFGRTTRA